MDEDSDLNNILFPMLSEVKRQGEIVVASVFILKTSE